MARATSSLPGDEHGAFGFRHELRRPDDLLHAAAASHDAVVVELFVALAQQIAVLGAQPLVVEGAAHHHEEFVDLERLLQIVEGAQLHRLDGAFDGGIGRHHQHQRPLGLRDRLNQFADEIEARHLGHQVVDDEQVE